MRFASFSALAIASFTATWAASFATSTGANAAAQTPAAASADAAPEALRPAPVAMEDMTWTEVRAALDSGKTTALVPVGGTEQSGPALTLGKHNVRVQRLSERIARELGNALVAPVVAYTPEGDIAPPTSHMRFAGTISIPTAAFDATLEAIARSLRQHGFRAIVFLGDHGGYQHELTRVAARLDREWTRSGVRVLAPPQYYAAASDGFARLLREHGVRAEDIGTHAALADTSLQLAIDPEGVRRERLHDGTALDAAHGVYGGDPRHASAELGALGIDEIVRASVAAIREALRPAPAH